MWGEDEDFEDVTLVGRDALVARSSQANHLLCQSLLMGGNGNVWIYGILSKADFLHSRFKCGSNLGQTLKLVRVWN